MESEEKDMKKKTIVIITILALMVFAFVPASKTYAANWSGDYSSKNLGYSSHQNKNYLCLRMIRKSKNRYRIVLFASRSSLFVNKIVKVKKGKIAFTDPETNGRWVVKRVNKRKLKVVKSPTRSYRVSLYKQ